MTLKNLLVNLKDKRKEKWNKQLMPFFRFCWPDGSKYCDEYLSQSLAGLCIESRELFEIVFEEVQYGISEILFPGAIFMNLEENELCSEFPDAALGLMAAVVGPNTRILVPERFKACLSEIAQSKPSLESSKRYRNLHARI